MTSASEAAARYVGRRTVMVAAEAGTAARAIGPPLITAGVEVHVVAAGGEQPWPGVASWNTCDLGSAEAIAEALGRIGSVVQHVFHCEPALDAFRAVALGARLLMPVGGSIVGAGRADPDPAVVAFVAEHAPDFAGAGIHLVTAAAGHALLAGLAGLA